MSGPGRVAALPAPRWPCGSSPRATGASSACSTARTSSSRWPGPYTSPISPRCHGPPWTVPTTSPWWKAPSRTPSDADRIVAIRASSRRLVTIGACATAGGIQGLRNFAAAGEYATHGLRPPRVHGLARDVHSHLGPCRGGLRAPRLSHRSAAAPRGDHRRTGRAQPGRPRALRVPGVQGAGHGVPARGRGNAVPGPGHPFGLWRIVSLGGAGMLRLLRPGGHRQYRVPGGAAAPQRHARPRDLAALRHLQRRRPRVPGRVLGTGRPGPGRLRTHEPAAPREERR